MVIAVILLSPTNILRFVKLQKFLSFGESVTQWWVLKFCWLLIFICCTLVIMHEPSHWLNLRVCAEFHPPGVIRGRAEQPDRLEFTWDLISKFKRDFIALKAMKYIDRKLLIKSPNFSNLALLSVSKQEMHREKKNSYPTSLGHILRIRCDVKIITTKMQKEKTALRVTISNVISIKAKKKDYKLLIILQILFSQ